MELFMILMINKVVKTNSLATATVRNHPNTYIQTYVFVPSQILYIYTRLRQHDLLYIVTDAWEHDTACHLELAHSEQEI